MLVLMILMGFQKSQAQNNEECFDANQIHRINEYRIECEKCKLDLTDTMLALKEARLQTSEDHSLVVVAGVVAFLVGALIGSSLK